MMPATPSPLSSPSLPRPPVSRWLIAALAAALLAIVVGGSWFYIAQRGHLQSQAETTLNAIAEMKALEVAQWRADQLAEGAELSNSVRLGIEAARVVAEGTVADRESMLPRLRSVQAHYHYVDVALVTPDGSMHLNVTGALTSLDPTARALVAEAIHQGRPLLGDFVRDGDAIHIDLAAPMRPQTPDGQTPVLLLRNDASHALIPLVQRWAVPSESAEAALVRRDDDAVLFLSHVRHRPDAALRLRIPLTDSRVTGVMAVTGHTGIVRGNDYRGVPVLSSLEAVPESPWFLIAKIDEDEAMSLWRTRAWLILTLIALAIATAIAATTALWKINAAHQYRCLLEADMARLQSEHRYRCLFDNSLSGVAMHELVLDTSGRPIDYVFLDANAAFERLTGLSIDDIRGKRVSQVLPDVENVFLERYAHVTLTGESVQFEQHAAPLKKWFSVSAYRVEPMRFATVFEDVSARKQSEAAVHELNESLERRVAERTAQLEAANRELEAFSYSVSHDLRAPLRAVIGYSTILEEDHASLLDGEARRVLKVIRDEATRMSGLIDDLLAFSRTNRRPIKRERIDMRQMAAQVLDEMRRLSPDRVIDLRLGDLPHALADPPLIRQVWVNLIGNAIKFTRGRSSAVITIEGHQRDGELVYRVADNGAGFDMEYVGKLFGVFQRLHRQSDFEGNGVGLALVHRIVVRHGGRVWAQGAPDVGATFSFTLPVSEGPRS